jgi:GT2 family glycosyltransferase
VTGLLTRSTIVVVTWRGKGHVAGCLDAVAAQTRPYRLLVVDNASDDGTAEVLARHPSTPAVLRLDANAGYAGALAAVTVDTEFTAWLNDDAEPVPDWLAQLEDALDQRKDAAAAASRMVGLDGSVISVGVGLTTDGHGVDLTDPTAPVFGFCGGAVLLRTEALRHAGGVPARYFCYYEDTDTAWRLRLTGHTIVSVPAAKVTHRHGASTQPGSRQFHLWNERNRLATLVRCAPPGVAAREVARFTAITAMLPLRRLAGRFRTDHADAHTVGRPAMLESNHPAEPANNPALPAETPTTEAVRHHPAEPGETRSVGPGENRIVEAVDNSPPAGRDRRWSPVAWKPGGPRAHERDSRSGSSGERGASRRSWAGIRRGPLVAWNRGPEATAPWNFRTGLRLQVLRELLVTLVPLLRERRTITRLSNVPRSVVWRGGRSTNPPS